MIKAVLFDIDGVIIRHQCFFAHTLPTERSVDPGLIMDSFYGSQINKDCDRGTIDPLLAVKPFLEKMAWKGDSKSYFNKQYDYESGFIDFSLLEKIHALRSRGFICCIASNQNHFRREYLKEKLRSGEYFDHAFFSSELGAIKPERQYWERVHALLDEKITGIDPGEIAFLDDMGQNIDSAEAYGFRGFLISNEKDIDDALQSIGGAMGRDSTSIA